MKDDRLRAKMNTIWDCFEETYGSKQWPPEDSNDSPYNVFKCKFCDWTIIRKMFGNFPAGTETRIVRSFENKASNVKYDKIRYNQYKEKVYDRFNSRCCYCGCVCNVIYDDIHHLAGRGKNLYTIKYGRPIHRRCHLKEKSLDNQREFENKVMSNVGRDLFVRAIQLKKGFIPTRFLE
jgi:hypothetical protein